MRDRSVLASEQCAGTAKRRPRLGAQHGQPPLHRSQGRVSEPCIRDNVKESYLTPADHPIVVRLTGAVPVGATCAWSFDDGDGAADNRPSTAPSRSICASATASRRSPPSTSRAAPDASQKISTEIRVRDILIAGLGDSIASGEGNPDRAGRAGRRRLLLPLLSGLGVRAILPAEPRRLQGRPRLRGAGHACRTGSATARSGSTPPAIARSTAIRPAPRWRSPCEYPHIAVTYLPLACTGATIADGLFGSQRARECPPSKSNASCQAGVNGQLAELRDALDGREEAPAGPPARSRAAVDRRQRHLFLRPRRRRHRRHRDRARAVPPHRRAGLGRRFTRRAGARPAAGFWQAARGAEAAGRRRPLACGLHLLRQPGAVERRHALPRRPRRLRHPSLLQRRPAAARRRRGLRAERIPARAEGARDCASPACCAAIPRPTA